MTKLGMDAGTMDGLVRQMQAQTRSITTIVARVDRLVYQIDAEWDGPKARAFVADWRARYRPALLRAHDHVAGLATAASNNISEQRGTSRVGERHAIRIDATGILSRFNGTVTMTGLGMTFTALLAKYSKLQNVPYGKVFDKVTVNKSWKMLTQGDKITSSSKLGPFLKYLGPIGFAGSTADLVNSWRTGANGGTLTGKTIGLGIEAVGLRVPQVALAYGAWQGGTWIGEQIAGTAAYQSLADTANDAILREGSRHVGGDPTTSPKAAAELTQRYSGPMGPIHYGKDWFGAVLHNR